MTCTHLNGGLQIPVFRQKRWFRHCLCCGNEQPHNDTTFPEAAGSLAATGVAAMGSRNFQAARDAFDKAAENGGDPRCHLASLLCSLGLTWCGNELHPTFTIDFPPRQRLQDTAQWQQLAQAADQLPPYVWQELDGLRTQLESILTAMREDEGHSACDVFLCYRRSTRNRHSALSLFAPLRQKGLRVFCADVTTRGKTQDQFEAVVCHALRTAEYMVIFPGDGEEPVTPWMRNEFHRATCPAEKRFICSDGHQTTPAIEGTVLSLEKITQHLCSVAAECTSARLIERAVTLLETGGSPVEALHLLERASARKSIAARLMLATLWEEGVIVPADAARAAHYRRLAGTPDAGVIQQVFTALQGIEAQRGIRHQPALIYIAADVSTAGLKHSRQLLQQLMDALMTNRHLSSAEVCLVSYDRHARLLQAPKPLDSYGAPVKLTTDNTGGSDQQAYAAKGLRFCASHCNSTDAANAGQVPMVVLLSTGANDDPAEALAAAQAVAGAVFVNQRAATLTSAGDIPGCIAEMLRCLQ